MSKKTHCLMQGKNIEVVTTFCYKPKPAYVDEYLCKPYHHIAVLNWNVGIVYIWDTREIVDVIQLSSADARFMVHANDNGQDLVIPDNLSSSTMFALQELQQFVEDI